MARKLVAYRRVSTKGQGESGLGLEAQEAAIRAYRLSSGCELIATYTEVESGRKSDRPQLRQAIAHAKRTRAKLVIAKLDRLSRDAGFLLTLLNSGLEVLCCDMPGTNQVTLEIMAVLAQDEARRISLRTKEALTAAKARGVALGGSRPGHPGLTVEAAQKGRRAAVEAKRLKAREAYADLVPQIKAWKAEGHSNRQIAGLLNAQGHTTRTGKPWRDVQVVRVLHRAL